MTIPDLLDTYRQSISRIQLWDANGLMNWIEDVAFWLARIEETDERKAQTEIFATTLATRVGKPVECESSLPLPVSQEKNDATRKIVFLEQKWP